jgi:hypothetical protein
MPELCAVTTIYNPANYRSRFRLYEDFRIRMEKSEVPLYTVELVTGDRKHTVTDAKDPYSIQVRSRHPLWHKENLVNIALERLPRRWDLVAWLDADIAFARADWAEATKENLKKHAFVQMFSHVVDLGPQFEPRGVEESFVYHRRTGRAKPRSALRSTHKGLGQTGYAWAARRHTLAAMGGLLETSILGSNDYFMAHALVGALTPKMTRMPGSNYAATLMEWQQRCEKVVRRNVGYVDTTILHYWHGRRSDRGYDRRWRILVENRFDPQLDLKKNAEGLLQLTDRNPALRKAIQKYFQSRKEDRYEA